MYRNGRAFRLGRHGVAVVATAVLVLGACRPDSSRVADGSNDDGPTTELSVEPQYDAGCSEDHPNRLDVETAATDEIPYLKDLIACSNDSMTATRLTNNSDAAWTISSTTGSANVVQLSETPRLISFRQIVQSVYAHAVLAPGSTVTVDAPPSSVEWTLAPGLSVMWLAHEQFADTLKSVAEAQLTDMLSGTSSLRRRALVTCSVAAYNVAGETASLLSGPEPVERLLAGLGIAASATGCATAWRKADEVAIERFGRTATWGDDVARWGRDAKFLEAANSRLTILSRIGKALGHLR
jgi:hypothetical protein